MTDVRSTTTYFDLIKYSRGHPVRDVDLATNMDLIDDALHSLDMGSSTMETSADPALNAAVSTAIIDANSGVIITLTGSGNAQTLQNPTTTTAGRKFAVVTDDGNTTYTIEVNGITMSAGEAQRFVWDGSAWVAITAVDADDIAFTPAGDISATEVQAAIEEVDTEKMKRITSVDNEIARFDSTGGDVQGYSSNAPTISDAGAAAVPGTLDIGTSVVIEGTKDEDDMTTDSAVHLATQQSIKAYADLKLAKASNLSDVADAATAFGNVKQDATPTATGAIEIATDAENVTGTETALATTPAGLTARLAAPGAIGGTTPAAGSFTTLESSSTPLLKRVSSTTVAFNAVAQTTLYTVPTGKIFIPVFAAIRITADASTTAVTFGRSTALTDWLGTQTLTSLDADGDYGLMMPAISATPGALKTYAAAVVFQIDVTTGSGGATNYVDMFGYVIDT